MGLLQWLKDLVDWDDKRVAEKERESLLGYMKAVPDLVERPDDWVPWNGLFSVDAYGHLSRPPKCMVYYRTRDGQESQAPIWPDNLEWAHRGLQIDIVAYRVATSRELNEYFDWKSAHRPAVLSVPLWKNCPQYSQLLEDSYTVENQFKNLRSFMLRPNQWSTSRGI